MNILVSVNPKNNAEEWWIAARNSPNIPRCVKTFILGEVGVTHALISAYQAADVIMWAQELPGWPPPEDANLPLLFEGDPRFIVFRPAQSIGLRGKRE